jgi:glycerol-3-phosphate O-acyltransferase
VSLQAGIALEVAERHQRGSRYKVPAFVAYDLMSQRSMVADLQEIAAAAKRPFEEIQEKAYKYLKEIAATHSPLWIDLVAQAIRWLIRTPYGGKMDYDPEALHRLYVLGQWHPVVFLPSHKSQLDHLVLQLALYENGLPPNHTAGGDNLNFWPLGPIVRQTGVFFIRRSFQGDPLYKLVVKRYLRYLIEKRFPLEWYIEGGRSRSGKLRAPRYGLLGYVVEAYRKGAADDIVLIPVSIAYDQIYDVSAYAEEQRGGDKQGESIKYIIDAVRTSRKPHGSIHLRFGEPLSVAAELPPDAPETYDPENVNVVVQKMAFEVCVRINDVTPITPISLVTLALLGGSGRAMTVEQVLGILEYYLNYLKQRDLPTTVELRLDTPEHVQAALEALVASDVVSRYDDGPEVVYAVDPDEQLAAAYYRNTIIHFFVNGAIAELAWLCATRAAADSDPMAAFWDEAFRLRDLLKFEFFFRRKAQFQIEVEQELDLQDPMWRDHIGPGSGDGTLIGFRPYRSHWVLRPFLEGYRIVADVLVAVPDEETPKDGEIIESSLALGKQYKLQRRIHSDESVSKELFKTALQLAHNRGVVSGGEDAGVLRREFRDEILEVLRRIESIDVLAKGRHAGLIA